MGWVGGGWWESVDNVHLFNSLLVITKAMMYINHSRFHVIGTMNN